MTSMADIAQRRPPRSRPLTLLWAVSLTLSLIAACAPMTPNSPYFAELQKRSEADVHLLYDGSRGVGIRPRDTATELDALFRDDFTTADSLLELDGFVAQQCGRHVLPTNSADSTVVFTRPASFLSPRYEILLTIVHDCSITKIVGQKFPPVTL